MESSEQMIVQNSEYQHVAQLTEKEKAAFDKMVPQCLSYVNEKVENKDAHPKFLASDGIIRFLVAREYNVDKAFEMFKKWVDWRLEFKADQINPESIKPLLLKETIILHKYDKSKRFCIIIRPRFHRPKEQTLEQLIQYGIFLTEQATSRTEEMGSKQMAVIYDRTGMKSENRDSQLQSFSLKFISMLQDFYAERLAMFYVINANWMYRLAYGIIKPFLAKKTTDKIKLLGSIEELKEYFDEECLLPEHGGSSDFVYDPYSEYGLKRDD